MICAGIDLSLTSPAICVCLDEEDFSFEYCKFECLTDNPKRVVSQANVKSQLFPLYNSQYERYRNISTWVMDVIGEYGIDRVFIEDYSFGSTGRVFHIAENTGILKYILWLNNVSFVTIPPTVVKKIATGKGNANKEAMETAFLQETNFNFKALFNLSPKQWNPSSDLIDSFYICKTGCLDYKKVV